MGANGGLMSTLPSHSGGIHQRGGGGIINSITGQCRRLLYNATFPHDGPQKKKYQDVKQRGNEIDVEKSDDDGDEPKSQMRKFNRNSPDENFSHTILFGGL